jgi:hypothetical protein
MANKISTDELKDFLEARAREFGNNIPNPAKAIAEQAANLRSFQEQVTKQFGETRSLLDSAKAFLKDPKAEGTRIVKDGLRSADKFFADLFKLLTKDVGTAFKTIIGGTFEKLKGSLNTIFGKQYNSITKWIATQFKNANNALFKIGIQLERSTSKLLQPLGKQITGLSNAFNKVLINWGKSSGLTKALQGMGDVAKTLTKNSQALGALKELPKAMGSLVGFVKLIGKAAPFISAFVDLYWKNDVTNRLKALEKQTTQQDESIHRNHLAVFTKLKQIEQNQTKGTTIDYAKIGSTVRSNIPADLARTRDVSSLSQSIGGVARAVAGLRIPAATVIDYARIQSGVTTAVNAVKTAAQTPPVIDYARIQSGVTTAVNAAKTAPQAPTVIDYARIASSIATSVTVAINAAAPGLASTITKQQVTPAQLAEKLAQSSNAQQQAQAAQLKQLFSEIKVQVPADIARKSDVDAIPSKIPKQTIDFTPILTRLTTLDNTLINIGQRIKTPTPVDLNPIQQQLNQLQNSLYQMPGQIGSNLRTIGDSITNNLTNVITNNNTTIVNKMAPALNPDAIINPIKNHINTQVAQPLATTMEVLNVNDLKRGVNMSAEAVIKASGFQQYGQAGTGTATNLIGLTAMMAAPLFMRAGFQKLGGNFDQSVMDPTKGKVKIDDALSASLWTFKQVDERLGLPNAHIVKSASGAALQMQHRNIQDGIEEINAQTIAQSQDLEIIERYQFAIAQDMMKLMQIVLQIREDVDALFDDAGFKYEEVKKSHPSHLKITAPGTPSSLLDLFQQGRIHYVARTWKGNADKSQILERIGLDTQIAAMSNKMEIPDPSKIDLPLDKSTARKSKAADDEAWKIFVSTMEEPPAGYGLAGNPIPEIKEIKTGTVREVPKPTNPSKKLGQ